MSCGRVASRCCALTKAGKRCGITSKAELRDSNGELVAEPLRRGGAHCRFHLCLFQIKPTALPCGCLLLFLDFETTGLSVVSDEIVEVGLVSDSCGALFGTVVRPRALPSKGDSVHGIPDAELEAGPPFPTAFARMLRFINYLQLSMVESEHEDTDEEEECCRRLPRMPDEIPSVLLVAHNGFRFDFPMLLSEAWRKRASLDVLTEWYYADSLSVFNARGAASLGGCVKLQCLVRSCAAEHLRAHRALDDAIALQAVAHTVAAQMGLSIVRLFAPVATQLDLEASVAELSAVCVCVRAYCPPT